jgi:antitoxin component of MazEF toxin-antitoxin module
MRKPQSTFLSIKKPWIGGNGETVYLGIPSNIVKQLQISENTHLMIDLVDDSVIVIKKHNPQFTKSEISRIQQNHTNDSDAVKDSVTDDSDDSKQPDKDYNNPLDRIGNL